VELSGFVIKDGLTIALMFCLLVFGTDSQEGSQVGVDCSAGHPEIDEPGEIAWVSGNKTVVRSFRFLPECSS